MRTMKRMAWGMGWMMAGIMAASPLVAQTAAANAEPAPVAAPAPALVPVASSVPAKVGSSEGDNLFAGTERFEAGTKNVTEVNLDKKMLGMAARSGKGADNSLGDMAGKMDFVYVREYEYPKPGLYQMSDLEMFRQRLSNSSWSHMVKERGEKENTDVWVKTDSEGVTTEMVVIDAEPTDLTFVHLKGQMSMKDLAKAGGNFGAAQAGATLKRRTK